MGNIRFGYHGYVSKYCIQTGLIYVFKLKQTLNRRCHSNSLNKEADFYMFRVEIFPAFSTQQVYSYVKGLEIINIVSDI